MRGIKFRAWDLRSLKWFDMSTFSITTDGIQVNVPGIGPVLIRKDYHLMQYTGLKDKNGVEIYEGDIVYRTHPNSGSPTNFVVRWNDNDAGWGHIQSTDGVSVKAYEVIGNIYENPELVK